MKLDANKLALSFGGAEIVLWVICSAFVALLASPMMSITGHMLHANMGLQRGNIHDDLCVA